MSDSPKKHSRPVGQSTGRGRLFMRFAAVGVSIVVATVLGMGALFMVMEKTERENAAKDHWMSQARLIGLTLSNAVTESDYDFVTEFGEQISSDADVVNFAVWDAKSTCFYASQGGVLQEDAEADDLVRRCIAQGGALFEMGERSATGSRVAHVAMPLFANEQLWGVGRVDLSTEKLDRQEARLESRFATLALIFIGMGVVGCLVLARNVSRPVVQVAEMARHVAAGEFGVSVKLNRSDELGDLASSFNRMIDGLRNSTDHLLSGAEQVTESVTLISSSTAEVSAAQSETSAAMTEAVATVETVKDSVKITTERSKHVSQISHEAAGVADTGRIAVRSSIDGIQNIQKEMEDIAQSIMALNEQGQAIAEIISTVNDLAERSNLLAVNAAIEAAKAGEEGRGFVVVADEIRGLAEQSKRSTAEVRTILNKIQKDTAASVMAAERGRKAVDQGIKQASEAGESIISLGGAIEDVAMNASEISSSMQQVDASVNQVFQAMASVLSATQQNESAIGDVANAVSILQRTATELQRRAARYNTAHRGGAKTPKPAEEDSESQVDEKREAAKSGASA